MDKTDNLIIIQVSNNIDLQSPGLLDNAIEGSALTSWANQKLC